MELDWQHEFYEIKDRGLHLLQTEKWADCRFLVGGAPPNQKIIAGHKLILTMASPVFERMFYGQLADKDDPIVIPDVQPDAFQAMLEYIYSDRINISSFDKACELCYVAKKYMLPHVVEQCTRFLWSDLSPKNACRAYEFAKLFDEPRLMQSSMELIAGHTREVLADPSFMDIEMSTLMAILDQDKLNIDSELDLFNALLRFASERGMFRDESLQNNAQNAEQNTANNGGSGGGMLQVEEIKMEPDVNAMMQGHDDDYNEDNYHHNVPSPDVVVVDSDTSATDASENESGGRAISAPASSISYEQPSTSAAAASNANASNLNYFMDTQHSIIDEDMLKRAVKKIRFLTMTPQQFAEGPARSKLLQQHEALAILIKISSPSINDCPMPEGFCSSRCSRNYYEQRSSQRDLSGFLHIHTPNNSFIQGSGNICNYAPMDASVDHVQPQILSSNRTCNLPANNSNAHKSRDNTGVSLATGGGDSDVATNDTRRSYCVRTVNPQFDYRNTSVTDCGLTFQVDTNIWITGVQVPTQVLCGELMNSAGFSERYTEILYAHIQDIQGSRLSYTHCTSRVRYDSLLEISFDRPVYIYRNQIYKVFVVFNKIGWYPMYTSVPDVICNRVKFRFNVGDPGESVRDGLIRAIVFSTPQDNSRHILE
ncbi:uncharacterized protein LOC119602725 [Lucilia sericata]|uniref:uncharacterized protein LOC119602725 n=1 Tax=Lucilia sericata TaxID=13632 RepID=UPI0018A7EBA8|nr:uncharacterized protein LOC119602725 [Lucilia sericata]